MKKASTTAAKNKSASGRQLSTSKVKHSSKPAAPRDRQVTNGYLVTVRYRGGESLSEIQFRLNDHQFYPIVQEWRYVVANRRRITHESRLKLSRVIFARLILLVFPDKKRNTLPKGEQRKLKEQLRLQVRSLAKSGVAEVEIPFENETVGWAARLFPWEQVIGLLTRPYRGENEPLSVVRFLKGLDGDSKDSDSRTPLMAVCSAPGELNKMFDLLSECRMVATALCPDMDEKSVTLRDPDAETLAARLKETQPSVVHFAGVDSNSLKSLGFADEAKSDFDGIVLKGTEGPYRSIVSEKFAEMLTEAKRKPTLVAISACFSAGRMAAMAVARGVRYAIGFQDTISDADALLFFTAFYQSWAHGADVLSAFAEARAQLSAQVSLQAGSGAVLWSGISLLTPPKVKAKSEPKRVVVKEPITLDIRPLASLNYSLLHNHRSPFEKFLILKDSPDEMPPLQVEVALSVGHEICHCRFTEPLPKKPQPLTLAEKIRLPLIAGVLRQCTESLRTNLYLRIQCGDKLLCERSDRITVLPADEWRDDGQDHCWLPSFVLPRDPAVLQVIMMAQRYLRALTDDCSAGFDGYQRLSGDDLNAAEVVDPQVQAIWAAIQYDLALAYINPPPSYSSQSQRLRTPTQILKGRTATCIDLALLFSSCLEYIGIYPVLFLIAGHAFPGYWRSDKAWWQMREFQGRKAVIGQVVSGESARTAATGAQLPGTSRWMFEGVDNLTELLSYVQSGELVPFESTFVALQRGFHAALNSAPANLHPQSFDAMVDVQVARGSDVTPLPIV